MKFLKSFQFAFAGILYCLKKGRNFKIQIVIAITVVVLGFVFKIDTHQWLAIIVCTSIVLSLEMLNTAIENLCNEITMDIKPSIKIIKDIAAGAVLVSAIASFIVGLVIFLPKFF